jgi:hypothetical protein
MMRSREAANESAAVANLRTLNTAEVTYLSRSGGNYGDMAALISAGLLDSSFTSVKAGYQFSITVSGRNYVATATPVSSNTGRFGYYSDASAVVRYSLDARLAPAGMSGSPVQ